MFSGVCRSAWGFFHVSKSYCVYAEIYVLQHKKHKIYNYERRESSEQNHLRDRYCHSYSGCKGNYRRLTNQIQARKVRYFAKGGDTLCQALQKTLSLRSLLQLQVRLLLQYAVPLNPSHRKRC